ncbi:unnamed protein product, partial [Iphiclides podalirius]
MGGENCSVLHNYGFSLATVLGRLGKEKKKCSIFEFAVGAVAVQSARRCVGDWASVSAVAGRRALGTFPPLGAAAVIPSASAPRLGLTRPGENKQRSGYAGGKMVAEFELRMYSGHEYSILILS